MKSTITCDMEGVIETMNSDAEKIFGYKKEELIGKKRVSIFSPGEIVLQNVEGWLNTAVKEGEYIGIITKTDWMLLVLRGECDPKKVKTSSVMT